MRYLHFYSVLFLLSVCFLFVSITGCTSEADGWMSNGRTATIRLDIPVLKSITRDVSTLDPEKTIHHLRVIIVSEGAKTINQVFESADLKNGNITIENVPVGYVQMFVIANEASLGRDYTDLQIFENDVDDQTKKILIKDADHKFFPVRGSNFPEGGLPMSWMDKNLRINQPADKPQEIEVNLVRSVAKLNILMSNALTTDIIINEMSFGEFFSNSLYLFAENYLDVPPDTDYETKKYSDVNITIKGGETKMLALYMYPSYAWTDPQIPSPYTIGFKTEAGKGYQETAFVNNYGALNSIARNTQVNIYATLSTEANVKIDFNVVDWTEKEIEVPSFN